MRSCTYHPTTLSTCSCPEGVPGPSGELSHAVGLASRMRQFRAKKGGFHSVTPGFHLVCRFSTRGEYCSQVRFSLPLLTPAPTLHSQSSDWRQSEPERGR